MEYCVLKKSSYWCFIFWGNAIVTVFFLIRFFSCFDIFDGSTAISDIASVLLWTGPGGSTSANGTYIVLAFLFWNLKKINFFVSLFPRLSQDAFRTPETWFFSSQCFYSVLYIYILLSFSTYIFVSLCTVDILRRQFIWNLFVVMEIYWWLWRICQIYSGLFWQEAGWRTGATKPSSDTPEKLSTWKLEVDGRVTVACVSSRKTTDETVT